MTDPLWLANYPENVQWDAEIPEGPLFAILDEAVERFPDNRAWTSSASATAMPSSATRWLYRRGGQGLRQAQDGAALEAGELKDFLVDKLGRHEMPKFVEFRDELPKTMIGKLSKKELVAKEAAASESASG